MKFNSKVAQGFALTGLAAALAACGGGGGSSGSALTVGGVAARGAALVNATVSVTCAQGTGTATTNSVGAYTVTFAGKGPCIVEVADTGTGGSGQTFRSLVRTSANSGSLNVNVNQFTTVIVEYLAGAAGVASADALKTSLATGNVANVLVRNDAFNAAVQALVNLFPSAAGLNPVSDDFTVGGANDTKLDNTFTGTGTAAAVPATALSQARSSGTAASAQFTGTGTGTATSTAPATGSTGGTGGTSGATSAT